MSERRILVTSALPYASGPIHIGHLVEYTQTDFWVRFQRLRGHDAHYFCADDTHGTAITIRARQEGRTEEQVIGDMNAQHQRDFATFGVSFDQYGSTHSDENRGLCAEIWAALRKAGLVVEREVKQLFDVKEGTFLADRFVKGTCPNCGSKDQYGDNCDKCGATYAPTDLIDPVSTLSGTVPELRTATHLFITIERFHDFLTRWIESPGRLDPGLANYLKGHFLATPLRDWDVSRPAPYFGFEISDAPGHYWYVWFDAPIGYMATTLQWCKRTGGRFDDFWRSPDTEIVHFIGKDIVYFHALFWPAMLEASGFQLPRRIQVHGMLTVNGEKMSKSKGTQIHAKTFAEHLDPAYLRYYYASKLSNRPDDLDLDFPELVAKVNSDIVGKVVNLASRTARFVTGRALATSYPDDGGLFDTAARAGEEIAAAYESCDTAKAMRVVMGLADRANEYVDAKQPWALKKKGPDGATELVDVCTVALNLFRQIAVYLTPVLPKLSEQAGALLGAPITAWADAAKPVVGATVAEFSHMMERVDPKKIDAVIAATTTAEADAAKTGTAAASSDDDGAPLAAEPLATECTIDDFGKVDLRVARILTAEAVPEADKLVKLTVTLGGDATRTIFAGIKAHYEPSALVGRLVIVVANLKPRKMRFGLSEGMVVAAGGSGESFLLSPDSGARPGQRVH
ncbi:MAG TPA: methionine--tRNA ligase [Polyangiaceae bacterium]|jgi:methionyl-tRNA synthetase|nr:methionine--tRNA ligase [Polyangiaceae bacterium]